MKGQVFPVLFLLPDNRGGHGLPPFCFFGECPCCWGFRRLGTALLDLLCCCLCGAWVFLCALAVDNGRLRLYQAALAGPGSVERCGGAGTPFSAAAWLC